MIVPPARGALESGGAMRGMWRFAARASILERIWLALCKRSFAMIRGAATSAAELDRLWPTGGVADASIPNNHRRGRGQFQARLIATLKSQSVPRDRQSDLLSWGL